MMWVFWSLVCFVTFMVMWPAFEKQIPADLLPWQQHAAESTLPSGGKLLSTQRKVGAWLFQESTDGWAMTMPAKEGVRVDSGEGEPPLLFIMCNAVWVEARAGLIEDPSATIKVKATLGREQSSLFSVYPARLVADNPKEVVSAWLATKEAGLSLKVPYADYGTQKFNFDLKDFPKAWNALGSTCRK